MFRAIVVVILLVSGVGTVPILLYLIAAAMLDNAKND